MGGSRKMTAFPDVQYCIDADTVDGWVWVRKNPKLSDVKYG